jgi:hypothetical protein
MISFVLVLTKRSQALTVNKVKKALRGAAGFLLSLFPLLHGRLACAEDRREYGLTHMIS